jgi:hypothetical protein
MATTPFNPAITDITPENYVVRAAVWNKVVVANLAWLRRAYGFRLYLGTNTIVAPTAEAQTVASTAGTATGGTFRVGFENDVYDRGVLISSIVTFTPPMAWNISLAAFTANLKALPGLGDVNQGVGIRVSGASLNAGFLIVFDGQALAGKDVPTLLENHGNLTGDTVTVTTVATGDPYSFIFVSDDQGNGIQTAMPGDPNLEGLWWFHGHATYGGGGAGSLEVRLGDQAPPTPGTVLAHADSAFGGSSLAASLDAECIVEIASGQHVGLWVKLSGGGLSHGFELTYLEGYYLGVVGEEDLGP